MYRKEIIVVILIIIIAPIFSVWSGKSLVKVPENIKSAALQKCGSAARIAGAKVEVDGAKVLPLGSNTTKVRKRGVMITWNNPREINHVNCVVAQVRDRIMIEKFEVNGEDKTNLVRREERK